MKRRDILKGGLAAGALALFPKASAQGAPQNQPSLGRRYRNLIVFVYDGFSWEDYAIAQAYARRRLGRALALERLLARYPNGLLNTSSLTGYVTESSAAGNALLLLYGQGLRFVQLGLVDNTHVFRLMGEALNLRYQNPVMSEEEALEILKTRPVGIHHPEDVWA